MGEHLSGELYGKVRVALMRREGLPSRVSFTYKFDEKRMGNAEGAIAKLFMVGLQKLCEDCRHAAREIRIATETAEKCPRRNKQGLCIDDTHPCSMKCERVAAAINAYRKEVNESAEKGQ